MVRIGRKGKLNTVCFRLTAVLAVCLLLAGFGGQALAFAASDSAHGADLTIELAYDDMPIPGASFSLYRVGDMNAGAEISLVEPFYGHFHAIDAKDRSGWDALAAEMAAFCEERQLTPLLNGTTDQNGRVRFGCAGQLPGGLYLVVGMDTLFQNVKYCSLPFLITLPSWNSETQDWDYSVCASPKLDRETAIEPTPLPTPTPSQGTDSDQSNEENLPQTGQLWWPVPVLLFVGFSLILLGLLQKKRA